jgi:AcrR family transcriptional regulator
VTDAKRARRPGGRPQDPEADRRIVAAAQKLLATEGFGRMSIEAVAAESGVAKTTIYRRYSDKTELAVAAIAELVPVAVPEPAHDAYRDLLAHLDFIRRTFDTAFLGALLGEERRNPGLLQTFRERIVEARVAIFREIVEAGIERGELRPDLDVDAAADLVIGSFFFRYLAEGRPDEDWPRRVLDAVWPALRAS